MEELHNCCSGSNMAANDGLEDGELMHNECEEDMVARHKKERKELQAQILKLKHTVTKGDKKKKKDVTEQIAKLEAELDARQNEELNKLENRHVSIEVSEENAHVENTDEAVDEDVEEKAVLPVAGKKSKAQKRRDKKQAKGKEREERIKEQAVHNKQGPRQQEMQKIKTLLKERGLQLYEIPADGNCLYNAVSHQLSIQDIKLSNDELRKKTAEYMRSHKEDFLPFLTNQDTGDILSPVEFEKYCDVTASSPAWGGQVELRALSEVLQAPIEVLQANTVPLIIGEDMGGKSLTLVYHRHVYRLGEHYNSVCQADLDNENKDGEEEEEEDDSALK